jgi:hypothetical protein
MTRPINDKELHRQEKLAKQAFTQAEKDVESLKLSLEGAYKIPIEVTQESKDPSPCSPAKGEPLWNKRTKTESHSVAIGPCHPWIRPYYLAHEFTHIALECEAHAAGVRRCFRPEPEVFQKLREKLPPKKESLPWELFPMFINITLDMVVEARVRRQFDSLRHAQYAFLNRSRLKDSELDLEPVPDTRHQAWLAILGSRALFADKLFGGTSHFARFADEPSRKLAERLYEAFASKQDFGPGDHYKLVLEFAEAAGLLGLYTLDPRPAWDLPQ